MAVARATGEAMGKTVILASDGPGFLVNRCGRPFGAEALRLLQERVATHEQIDRICRLGGGFRMGPFELMDLVGVDVGFEVAKSFTELSFGEPRWKPSPIQSRMVAAGRLGRKTGRGYYDYPDEGAYRPEDPEPLEPGGGDGAGRVASWARGRWPRACASAPTPPASTSRVERRRRTARGRRRDRAGARPLAAAARCRAVRRRSARRVGRARARGLSPPAPARGRVALVELTRNRGTPGAAAEAAERVLRAPRLPPEWVADAPGLVLGRIVCQLVNEAAFAVGEGVGSADDVDAGLTLGLNHPRGAVAWGDEIGLDHVLATIDGLWAERREERYRAAPLLRAGKRNARLRPMATADLTVLALGRPGVSASEYIAEIQRRLARQDRVRYRMHAMGTSLEGSTEDILALVGELHAVPFEQGIPRVYTVLKLDERRDRPDQTLDDKVRSVEDLLGED